MYYLLHATALLLPVKASNHLRVLLRTRALASLRYGEVDLETLLLSTAGEYTADEDMVTLIGAALHRSDDLAFLLTSFRILASHGPEDTWEAAVRILSLELDTAAEALFADELRIIADEQRWPTMYRWYSESLTLLDDALSGKLLQIIKRHLIPAFEEDIESTKEPAFHLMKAHVAVAMRQFTSQNLMVLARFVASKRGYERKKCIEGIRVLYEFGRRLSGEPTWFYVDHDEELDIRLGLARGVVGFVSRDDSPGREGLGEPTYLSKNSVDERELIDIIVAATPEEPFYRPVSRNVPKSRPYVA